MPCLSRPGNFSNGDTGIPKTTARAPARAAPSDFDQGDLGNRASRGFPAARTGPLPLGRRTALYLGFGRRNFLRFRRHRSVEIFETELVAPILVPGDDNPHVAARF